MNEASAERSRTHRICRVTTWASPEAEPGPVPGGAGAGDQLHNSCGGCVVERRACVAELNFAFRRGQAPAPLQD